MNGWPYLVVVGVLACGVFSVNGLYPARAEVTYVDGTAPDDRSPLFGSSSGSFQTKGFSANFNSPTAAPRGDVEVTTVRSSRPYQPRSENYANVYYSTTPSSTSYYSTSTPSTTVKAVRYTTSTPSYSRVAYLTTPSVKKVYVTTTEPQYKPTQRTYVTTRNYQTVAKERETPIYEPSQELRYVKKSSALVSAELPRVEIVSSTPANYVRFNDRRLPYQTGRYIQKFSRLEESPKVEVVSSTPVTAININTSGRKATIQVPYVGSERVQAHAPAQTEETYEVVKAVPPPVVQKTNVITPIIKKTTYEVRKPAVEKQFFDIEEHVIVRPAGTVVVELDGTISKVAKGETVRDAGDEKFLVASTARSDTEGVVYATSTTPSSSVDYDDERVEVEEEEKIVSSTTERTYVDNGDDVVPRMISVGDPDFNAPPYVQVNSNGEAQKEGEVIVETSRYTKEPTSVYFGRQSQYVPVSYNNQAQRKSAKQIVYYRPGSTPCPPQQQEQSVTTYYTIRPVDNTFSYSGQPSQPPLSKLPPPPDPDDVEEIDVVSPPSGKFRYGGSYKSGRIQDNEQIYSDLVNQGKSSGLNISDAGLGPGERVISATPAPPDAKPASQSVQSRRIVVNHPFETVSVVEEEEEQAKLKEITVKESVVPQARYRTKAKVTSERLVSAPYTSSYRTSSYSAPYTGDYRKTYSAPYTGAYRSAYSAPYAVRYVQPRPVVYKQPAVYQQYRYDSYPYATSAKYYSADQLSPYDSAYKK